MSGTLLIKIELQWSEKDTIIGFILVLLVIFKSVCTLSITNLHIFSLAYILLHSIGLEVIYINQLLTNVTILYPLKIPGNQKASSAISGYKIGAMARNNVIKFIILG